MFDWPHDDIWRHATGDIQKFVGMNVTNRKSEYERCVAYVLGKIWWVEIIYGRMM